jgi:hypothetical protein
MVKWWWIGVFVGKTIYILECYALGGSVTSTTRGVSHYGLAIYIKKYLNAKKKNYGNSNIFHHAKIYQSSKKSSKRNQNPSRYYNSIITNLKFQYKPNYHLSKNPHIKIYRPIIYDLGAYKNPLSY